MPKVHTTKARIDGPKACPQAKAGQVYYWWRTRMKGARSGITRCSLTYPKPSQLTMSEFWGAVYSLQEAIESDGPFEDAADLALARDQWAEQARDIGAEQEDKLNNMPEGLQEGDAGQLLQERAEACETWADEIEAVTIPEWEDFEDSGRGTEEFLLALEDALQEIASLQPACD